MAYPDGRDSCRPGSLVRLKRMKKKGEHLAAPGTAMEALAHDAVGLDRRALGG